MSGSKYLLWSYGQLEKMTFFPTDPLTKSESAEVDEMPPPAPCVDIYFSVDSNNKFLILYSWYIPYALYTGDILR